MMVVLIAALAITSLSLAAVTIATVRALVLRDKTWDSSLVYIKELLRLRGEESARTMRLWDALRARERVLERDRERGIPIEDEKKQEPPKPFSPYDTGEVAAAVASGEIAGYRDSMERP